MSKLTIDDLVAAQQNVDKNLQLIAAILRDDEPRPMSTVSYWIITLTYAILFVCTGCGSIGFVIDFAEQTSAPQQAALSASFAASVVAGYVLARCIELSMRARDRI